jgi:hypothetical protein
MAVKYYIEFKSVRDELIRAELSTPSWGYDATQLLAPIEQPITIERNGQDQRLTGLFGTVCSIRLINNGEFDVTEFLPNNFTDWYCEVFRDGAAMFKGFIVIDDIQSELRAEPKEFVLRFADNLGLLSDIEAPFYDATQWTPEYDFFRTFLSMMQDMLALTGLDLPLNIFFSPYPITSDPEQGTWEQIKLQSRTFADSLTKYKKCKDVINEMLKPFDCRLYQQGGEWYIVRINDLLYTEYGTLYGWRYDGYEVAPVTLEMEVETPIFLQFSQSEIFKRPNKRFVNEYTYNPGYGILNADLQVLGDLVDTNTAGGVITERYEAPFYNALNGADIWIQVEIDEATDTEIERFLAMDFAASIPTSTTAVGFHTFPILVSEKDRFDINFRYRGPTNSSERYRFNLAVYIVSTAGFTRRLIRQTAGSNDPATAKLVWTTTTEGPFEFSQSLPFLPGGGEIDNTEYRSVGLLTDYDINDLDMPPFPFDGIFFFVVFGYNNATSGIADLDTYVKDLRLDYRFFVNDSVEVEKKQHIGFNELDTLKEELQTIVIDDTNKYSAMGTIYDQDSNKTTLWNRYQYEAEPKPIGQITAEESIDMLSIPQRSISGNFESAMDFGNVFTFEGLTYVPTALKIDLHRQQVSGEFRSMPVPEFGNQYELKYIYKTNAR